MGELHFGFKFGIGYLTSQDHQSALVIPSVQRKESYVSFEKDLQFLL